MSSNYDLVHVQKRISCNNSVDMFQQTCYQQADISMRLHSLCSRPYTEVYAYISVYGLEHRLAFAWLATVC